MRGRNYSLGQSFSLLVCSSWVSDTMAVLLADELPQDVTGAEAVLANHVEHKGEIDTREPSFVTFKLKGQELVAAKHYANSEVRNSGTNGPCK